MRQDYTAILLAL